MNDTNIHVIPSANMPHDESVNIVRDILARFESGEFVEIQAVCTRANGTYLSVGTASKNTAASAGKLLARAIDVLQDSKVDI